MHSTGHGIVVAAITLSVVLFLSACAAPVGGLWPPLPDSPAQTIIVSLDTWHAMIALPIHHEDSDHASIFGSEERTLSQHAPLRTLHSYEEWGYAERAWYVEGKTGVIGIVRALFWPTEGVVEVGHHDRVCAIVRRNRPPNGSSIA